MRSIVLLLISTLVAGCSALLESELARILDQAFNIGALTKKNPWATGIGCGGTKKDALDNARNVAQYNLRSLTGPTRYRVEYSTKGPAKNAGPGCWEVEARAGRPG